MTDSVVTNWDDMERVYEHTFFTELDAGAGPWRFGTCRRGELQVRARRRLERD